MPRTLKKQLTALAASSLLVGATLSIATAQQPSPDPAVLAKGEYLARAGDCIACHTMRGGQAFAGGRPMPTPFGTLYTANITSDNETGIGK